MRIGELGERAEVSTKTIRYYESLGLLDEPARTPAGYRDYDDAALERLRFVRDAQATGLSLAEIASVLELKSSGQRSCAHTTDLLERHLVEIDQPDRPASLDGPGRRSARAWPSERSRSTRRRCTRSESLSGDRSRRRRHADQGLTFQPTGRLTLEGMTSTRHSDGPGHTDSRVDLAVEGMTCGACSRPGSSGSSSRFARLGFTTPTSISPTVGPRCSADPSSDRRSRKTCTRRPSRALGYGVIDEDVETPEVVDDRTPGAICGRRLLVAAALLTVPAVLPSP